MNVAVIGSGVSGIAAAHALIERGAKVTIIDVGETLDERRSALVEKLKALPTAEWPDDDMAFLGENHTLGEGGLPKKVFFGSDRIYADERSFARTVSLTPGRAPFPTFTKGGFSNIWGAAALAVDSCDMADWPVSRSEMDPYFAKAASLMPLCGGAGTLSRSFPAYREVLGDLDPGPQGEALLEDLERAERELLATQTLYGKARLALHTAPAEGGVLPCNGCGYCFTGCVRGSIFATVPTLEKVVASGSAGYRSGLFVRRVAEDDGQAVIDGIDLDTETQTNLAFDAVFIACGPINTTRILLASRDLYDHPVTLLESQKFVIPMIRRRGADTAIDHPSVTLASVFIETKVPKLSDHWVHVQVVPMNQLIFDGVGVLRRGGRFAYILGRPLFRHLTFGWAGMHSDHSSSLELTLRHDGGDVDRLDMALGDSENARAAGRLAAKALYDRGKMFGTLFCHRAIRFSNPGSGTHCGSSFPMRREPRGLLDTDRYGRPFGWSQIFAVDSSVLPSIPGTTLAFTAMANATRIAETAPLSVH